MSRSVNDRLPYWLVAPSALFLVVIFVWPLTETIWLAFTKPGVGLTTEHLTKMRSDVNFQTAFKNTLLLVVAVVPLQLAMALLMATLLDQLKRGRDAALFCWTIPLGVSDLAAGLAWLAIFSDRGYFNSTLQSLGLVSAPVSWLSYQSPLSLFVCVVIAEIWRATAIMLVILVAGMQTIPKEYNEAAQVFGATPWTRFWRITLPLLKPSLQTALILRTVLAFEVFAVVYALAGRDFPVLVGEAYNWQGTYQNSHVASMYALLILVISILATLVYLRLLRVRRETLE